MNASTTFPQVWATGLQERLTGPTNWKEICEVHMMDDYTKNIPYMSTEFSLQSGTRGTAYSHSDFTLTNDTLTVSNQDIVSVFLDRADAAQQKFVGVLEAGRRQGDLINERVEDLFLAQHAGWTDFGSDGSGGYGLYDVAIGITSSNIDSVTRAIKREIIKAKGSKLARRNGIAIVWRPEDFEKLEESMASQGYTFADQALRDGIMDADGQGKYAFGVYHYVSESHASGGHVFAGVRKIMQLGLLKSTYGRIYHNPNAVSADGPLSGESHEARLDYGFNPKAGLTSILFDVRVS